MTTEFQPLSDDLLQIAQPLLDLAPTLQKVVEAIDELKALGEDIKAHGLAVPVALWVDKAGVESYPLLDGRNRLDAMEAVGLCVVGDDGELNLKEFTDDILGRGQFLVFTDPYEFVLSANVHRRHLTAEQKRDLIAEVLTAQPKKSNRRIAAEVKADHKTVGSVRQTLEGRGEIPHVETVTDTKGRQQLVERQSEEVNAFSPESKAKLDALGARIRDNLDKLRAIEKRDAEPVDLAIEASKPGPMTVTPPGELTVAKHLGQQLARKSEQMKTIIEMINFFHKLAENCFDLTPGSVFKQLPETRANSLRISMRVVMTWLHGAGIEPLPDTQLAQAAADPPPPTPTVIAGEGVPAFLKLSQLKAGAIGGDHG